MESQRSLLCFGGVVETKGSFWKESETIVGSLVDENGRHAKRGLTKVNR